MSSQKRLGKGLESLIPKDTKRGFLAAGKTITQVRIEEIATNPYQPRLHFDSEDLAQLAHSIKKHGLQQPILVRRQGDNYELIAGERRLRASKDAGCDTIPAIVKDVSDKDSLKIALIENLDRSDLNPMEESKGYQRLIEEFELTHQGLSEMFRKSRSSVTNTLRLLRLPEPIQHALMEGVIKEGHARSLLALKTDEEIESVFAELVAKSWSVRELETKVSEVSAKPKPMKKNPQLPLFDSIRSSLSDRYQSSFKFRGNEDKGRITIDYTSRESFEKTSFKASRLRVF